MLILPAIDILNGRCVRLMQGDFRAPTVYSGSPAETARSFMEQGFSFLHVVDLDGARDGTVRNSAALQSLLAIEGLKVQAGGGIRTAGDVEKLLSIGVQRIVTGSVAVRDPESVLRWVREFGSDRFTIALDVRGDTVATNGWTTHDRQSLHDLITWYLESGVPSILCTDIERDGMLTGPNIGLYRRLLKDFPGIELIASGGISSLEDIRALQAAGVQAAVVGKALYEGAIRLQDLLDLIR
ncbi:MAG TPA: 1-(5-phosphoribosyl)-5-[(5-phosphoribosylamino)methylideneamino]imidazole-4-carboxamide isomerase [Bacteroidota bacterium]